MPRNESRVLWPDTAPICHIVLFACGLVDLGRRIDRDRKIAIWIKTGRGNGNWSEHRTLARLQRRSRNIHHSTGGKSYPGNRGRSIPLALILDDDSQLGHPGHITVSIRSTKTPVRNGYEVGAIRRYFRRDASSGHEDHPEAAEHCRSRSTRVYAHNEKPILSMHRIVIVRLIQPCAMRFQIFPATVWHSVFATDFALSISNP